MSCPWACRRDATRRAVLPAGGEEGHQPPDRAGDPAGRQDGRQGAQPRRAQQGQLATMFLLPAG